MYTLFHTGTTYDSITYFDNDLNRLWGIDLPSNIIMTIYSHPVPDASGNLYMIVNNPVSLMKITKDGAIAFTKAITRPVFNTIELEDYAGPVIDNNGRIAIVQCVVDYNYKEEKGIKLETNYGYYYLFRTDTANATPLKQSIILKKDKALYFKDAGTKSEDFQLDDYSYLLKNLILQNGSVVVGGMHSYQSRKVTKSWKEEALSQWRMMVARTDGKTKKFSFKGTGGDTCNGGVPGLNYRNDDKANNLEWIGHGTGDNVCLIGTIAKNRLRCGEGEWKNSGVVMGYNLSTNKVTWKIKAPDTGYGAICQKESGKILAGFYDGNSMSYQVFDQNGNRGPLLSFPEGFPHYPSSMLKEINKKDDVMYLNLGTPSGWYFGKFSLPTMQFTPATFSSFVEEPMQFSLQQNYPNPFNPSTKIEFTLPQASVVTLKIYNMLGQEVETILNRQEMEEGYQEIEYNGSVLSSGVYFYRLEANELSNEDATGGKKYTELKKMILMK
ncbi:MAG: T9SS type A sorting domain-containing protein [Ignavibacteriales bacterium]|nr:T9SS type A sorting domain-containing protein [Ignavibacteriales bacterium]